MPFLTFDITLWFSKNKLQRYYLPVKRVLEWPGGEGERVGVGVAGKLWMEYKMKFKNKIKGC